MARANFGIKDKDLDNIIQEINNIEKKEIDNILNQDIFSLKKDAAIFLQTIIEVQDKIKKLESMMWNQKKMRDIIRKELGVSGRWISEYETEQYKINREEITNMLKSQEVEKLYQAAFDFHKKIIQALGKEIQTIIILQDKEGTPYVFKVTEDELFNNNFLSYEGASKTERLTARFKNTVDQMRNAGIKAINRDDLNIDDKMNIKNLNETYKTSLYRYDTYKRLILWYFPNGIWNKIKVSARGDLAEAYAMFFLKQAKWNFQSSNKEENIHYFMILGVSEVDNVSGLLQGDISTNQYEYAIKSADASYMSVQQMIPLAKKILEQNNYSIIDLQKYRDYLANKKSKIRNPIALNIENVADTEINNTMKDMLNKGIIESYS